MKELPDYITNLFNLGDGEEVAFCHTEQYTCYFVTSWGRIFSIRAKHITGQVGKRGYRTLRTMKRNLPIHRLVAKAFIPNPEDKAYINHKNGIKTDNNITNLEWVTPKENYEHAIATGLTKPTEMYKYAPIPKKGDNAKFTIEQAKRVVHLVRKKGYSYTKAGATEGMSYSTVAHIMTGRRYVHANIEGIKPYEKK
jgi:hypothetical protein